MRRIVWMVAALMVAVGATQIGASAAIAAPGSIGGLVELREAGVITDFEGVTMTLTPTAGGAPTSTTTDGDGRYSLSVEEGEYTLTAEPPDASGLTPSTRTVTIAAGSNPDQNFLFSIVESRLTVSGVITGPSGAAVNGATVTMVGPDPADGDLTTTDATGAYSLSVLPRTYSMFVNASAISPFPDRYSVVATVTISADSTISAQLPGSLVTVRVVDSETGAPIDATLGVVVNGSSTLLDGQPTSLRSSVEQRLVTGGSIDALLVPGTGSVSASADGYLPAPPTAFTMPTSSVERPVGA